MGNSRSQNHLQQDRSDSYSDFEPIDTPLPTTITITTITSTTSTTNMGASTDKTNPNDLSTSGVLVDMTEEEKASIRKRRIVKASKKARDPNRPLSPVVIPDNDHHDDDDKPTHDFPVTALKTEEIETELLRESIEADKQQRFLKLQHDQKNKRNKAIEERRKNLHKGEPSPQPNPFSKFLKAFSVEPEFPEHKRAYEDGEDPLEGDAKRPKLSKEGDEHAMSRISRVLDWLDDRLPEGWPYMAAAAVTTCVVVTVSLRMTRLSPSR